MPGSALLPIAAVRPGARNLIGGHHDHHIRHRVQHRIDAPRRSDDRLGHLHDRRSPGPPAHWEKSTAIRARGRNADEREPPRHARNCSPRWRPKSSVAPRSAPSCSATAGGAADRRGTRIRSFDRAAAWRVDQQAKHHPPGAQMPAAAQATCAETGREGCGTESGCRRIENEQKRSPRPPLPQPIPALIP